MTTSTATSAIAHEERSGNSGVDALRGTVWRDYCILAKPRITLMILLTVGVAMVVAYRTLGTSVHP